MNDPITVKIPPDVYAAANNYVVDVADGDTKAWFDVRDAVAKAIMAERERCAKIAEDHSDEWFTAQYVAALIRDTPKPKRLPIREAVE